MNKCSLFLTKYNNLNQELIVSPRPKRNRIIEQPPSGKGFKPLGAAGQKVQDVILNYDEFEALKLADYENLTQEKAAKRMNVSRPTFTRIYDSALKKIAISFVERRTIRIMGGQVNFTENWYSCHDCQEIFKKVKGSKISHQCPICGSEHIVPLIEKKVNDIGNKNENKSSGNTKGFCICPKCKIKMRSKLNIPCNMTFCPECGIRMKRGYRLKNNNKGKS
jgi:predicted DNA-binding protein (UPF0251 family)